MYMHTRNECVLLNSTTHLASKVTWAPHWISPGFPLKLATLVSGNRRCFHSPPFRRDVLTFYDAHKITVYNVLSAFQIVVYVSLLLATRCDQPFLYGPDANCSSALIWWFLEWVHSWYGSVVVITVWSKLQEIHDLVVLEHGTAIKGTRD